MNKVMYIYQMKQDPEYRNLRNLNYEEVQRELQTTHYETLQTGMYDLVYDRNITEDKDFSLDNIFEEFNIRHPVDFKGHSLSMGDFIVIEDKDKQEEKIKAYYVDKYGFIEYPDFANHVMIDFNWESADEDYFYIDESNEDITWIYYNPDSNAGGQFVETTFSFDALKKEKQAYEPPYNEEQIKDIFDIIHGSHSSYLYDINTGAEFQEYFQDHLSKITNNEYTSIGYNVDSLNNLILSIEKIEKENARVELKEYLEGLQENEYSGKQDYFIYKQQDGTHFFITDACTQFTQIAYGTLAENGEGDQSGRYYSISNKAGHYDDNGRYDPIEKLCNMVQDMEFVGRIKDERIIIDNGHGNKVRPTCQWQYALNKVQQPKQNELHSILEEKQMKKECLHDDLIATYEDVFNVPTEEKITEYAGDYSLHYIKRGISDEDIKISFEKALNALNITEEEFYKNDDFSYRSNIAIAMYETNNLPLPDRYIHQKAVSTKNITKLDDTMIM